VDIAGTSGFNWSNPIRNKDDRQNVPGNIFSSLGANAAIDPMAEPEKTGPDPVQEFKDYMAKTPEQRMQEAWLQSHGITQEEFDAMSPEEKQSLMDMMKHDIEDKMRQEAAEGGRKRVDILV